MPRAIWSGSIAFGLVNAPVRLYPAIAEHDLRLHLVHARDGARIRYRKVCEAEGKEVPDSEIAKAYELDGELVLLDDEDFTAAEGASARTIEILAFVPREEIDSIYFERTYYVGPAEGAGKVYALLVEAMERVSLVALVRFVFRDREQLGSLRVRDDVLLLEQMYYADEIRAPEGIAPERATVDERELELALLLVERFKGTFEPERFEDAYRARLLEIVEQKRRGRPVSAPQPPAAPEAPDLLAALRESVARVTGNGAAAEEGSANGSLSRLRVAELREHARSLGIDGRSRMSKQELVDAIEAASG